MKKSLMIILFVFTVFFGISVKAERYEVVFRCSSTCGGNSSNCTMSISDGKFNGGLDGCKIPNPNASNGGYKVEYSGSSASISGNSKCYELSYTCKLENSVCKISDLKFNKTDATANDASKGIICASAPVHDICDEVTEDNFKEKCKSAPSDATYEKFRNRCDLSYQDAMDYCEGKGDYVGSSSNRNKEGVDEIKRDGWAEDEYGISEDGSIECTTLLGKDNVSLITNILLVIAAVGVVMVVIYSITDFTKAVAASDDDGLAKSGKHLKNRIISVIALLLLPALINFLLGFINDNLHYEKIKNNGDSNGTISIKVGNVSDCGID